MEAATPDTFGSLPGIVVAVILGFVFWKLFQKKFRARRAYNNVVMAFRWDPNMDPLAFERHCADFLSLHGWKARTTRGSGDQGVDVLAVKAGVRIVLQCKKYSRPVGNKAVQEAHAAKAFAQAHVAAVVSNMGYTPGAKTLARSTGVLLLHFTDLADADRLFGIPTKRSLSGDASFFDNAVERMARPCPRCRAILRLPKGRTGTVRCPECGSRFMAVT